MSNLSQDVPQKVINLGEWHFLHFVKHTQMAEKKIFNGDSETNSNIMFLAEYNENIRLMCFKSDPWTRDDIADHKIFMFSGVLDISKASFKKN